MHYFNGQITYFKYFFVIGYMYRKFCFCSGSINYWGISGITEIKVAAGVGSTLSPAEALASRLHEVLQLREERPGVVDFLTLAVLDG